MHFRLILKGYKQDLDKDDIYDVQDSEKCQKQTEELENEWKKLLMM